MPDIIRGAKTCQPEAQDSHHARVSPEYAEAARGCLAHEAHGSLDALILGGALQMQDKRGHGPLSLHASTHIALILWEAVVVSAQECLAVGEAGFKRH